MTKCGVLGMRLIYVNRLKVHLLEVVEVIILHW
jgi:hypothetical protein